MYCTHMYQGYIHTAMIIMLWYFCIITVYSNSLLEVETEVLSFGVDDITISLSWTQEESSIISYIVSIIPQATVTFIQSTNIHLTVSYNARYNVTIVGTLCGRDISSTAVELNYGEHIKSITILLLATIRSNYALRHTVKCTSLLHQLGSDIRINGYSDPASEGANVTLECISPNLVHMGPNVATCMVNGKWEPDPREVICLGESYILDSHLDQLTVEGQVCNCLAMISI